MVSAIAVVCLSTLPETRLEFFEKRADRLARESIAAVAPADRYGIEMSRAEVALQLGDNEAASRSLAAAIDAAIAAGKPDSAASARIRRSQLLILQGAVAEAEHELDLAAAFAAEHRTILLPYIDHYRGLALWKAGRCEEAMAPLARSIEALRKSQKYAADEGGVQVTLGSCYFSLGQYALAEQSYERARTVGKPSQQLLAESHLGVLLSEQERYREAAALFRGAAARSQSDPNYLSMWLTNLAETLVQLEDWSEAEQANRRALAVEASMSRPLWLTLTRINQARIESGKRNFKRAETLLDELAGVPKRDDQLEVRGLRAELYQATGRTPEAEREYQAAIALAGESSAAMQEDENKVSKAASLIGAYRGYVRFLVGAGRIEEALRVAETSRARLLRERLEGEQTAVAAPADSYREVARQTGATLLEYWIAPKDSLVWVITGDQITAVPLRGQREIAAAVDAYRASIETSSSKPDRAAAGRLFDLLVPAAARGNRRYIIVPDGPVAALNFETLATGGRYWIEDATLAVAPSLDLLAARVAPAKPSLGLLAMGDALSWDPAYPPLVNSAAEVQAVARTFPAASQTLLTGAAATPAAYAAAAPGRYRYLHFSAHAVANRDRALDSAIILSSGRLAVSDILKHAVNARLVTLSACRSAGARAWAGEGLVGLAWAFMRTGARQVAAGLWNVSDYASARLMESMYQGIAAGNAPGEALRAAKLKLLADPKFASPYYWGAFELFLGAAPE